MDFQDMGFDQRYRAVQSRDHRCNGRFVLGVKTTGIYCRPSCPARIPRPENVRSFRASAAAHAAGFRACKRCLPEAVPGSPQWNLRGDVTGRAMRLINDGVIDQHGVSGPAQRLGYSTRHLTRILRDETGAGPLAFARAHRAQTARVLLTQTTLPVSDIAFSAGFSSVRQFNETIHDVYDLSPQQVRAHGHRAAQTDTAVVDVSLSYRGPLDLQGLFVWFAARAIPGLEPADTSSYARAVNLSGGPAWFRVYTPSDSRGDLRLQARVTEMQDLPVLMARVRRLFDLDADPVAVDTALTSLPAIRPLGAAVPGIRVAGCMDPHELLIRTMICQQISVPAAGTILTRITTGLGEFTPEFVLGLAHMFPTMEAIAERGSTVLRGPKTRQNAVGNAAEALATGQLRLGLGDDPTEQRKALLALKGVGPWAADYVRMRVTGDPDMFLIDDGALRAGARRAGLPAGTSDPLAWSAHAPPWRSYLTTHPWRVPAVPAQPPEGDHS